MVRGGVDMTAKKARDAKIGLKIKKAREAAGFTQDRFAELIGMGTKNVSAIERGLAGISVPALKRICETLSVSSDSLIMDNYMLNDDKELSLLTERLKQLHPTQLDLVMEINNKLFEVFALHSKDSSLSSEDSTIKADCKQRV